MTEPLNKPAVPVKLTSFSISAILASILILAAFPVSFKLRYRKKLEWFRVEVGKASVGLLVSKRASQHHASAAVLLVLLNLARIQLPLGIPKPGALTDRTKFFFVLFVSRGVNSCASVSNIQHGLF